MVNTPPGRCCRPWHDTVRACGNGCDQDAMLERIRTAGVGIAMERAAVREELNDRTLTVRWRGYDRVQVDMYLQRAIDQLA
jgi:DivIVA domain-containing protein